MAVAASRGHSKGMPIELRTQSRGCGTTRGDEESWQPLVAVAAAPVRRRRSRRCSSRREVVVASRSIDRYVEIVTLVLAILGLLCLAVVTAAIMRCCGRAVRAARQESCGR